VKKLLLPVEGDQYPQELLEFVATINPAGPVLLTAVFVPKADYVTMMVADDHKGNRPLQVSEARELRAYFNSRKVKKYCDEMGISVKLHMDNEDFALPCLRKESRFADLILLSERHFFEEREERQPNAWMRDLLHRSECPLLLLPDKAERPGELILAYDGSAESVYAIKQFAYLFPEFMQVKATLFYINDDPEAPIPEAAAMKDLGVQHYKKFRMMKVRIGSEEFFGSWLGMANNPWLITGSYGRTALSVVLHKPFSAPLIREHKVPVFVAHR
jgi:hypothetical protein